MNAPDTAFTRTTVASAQPAGSGQVRLLLVAPEGYLAAHRRPGQYCELRLPGGVAAPYALASTPAEGQLSFLIKASGEPGEALAGLGSGAVVEVAPPAGPGFALERAVGRDLAFVATGTGIAPIGAALAVALGDSGRYGALSLYYGVRDERFVAVADELRAWSDAGVRVRVHHSRPTDGEPIGSYVQHLLLDDAPEPSRTTFVVAGHAELVEAIRDYVAASGVVDAILENV